jgi:hypothetical protein
MSAVPTTADASPVRDADGPMLIKWIGAALALCAVVAVAAVLLWPDSAADKARDDGQAVGAAVQQLSTAESQADIDAALADLDSAITDTRAHAGDAVADQMSAQADALASAADGAYGAATTDDAWDQELYEAEFQWATDELVDNASDFRAEGPEVHQAFWQGVQDGIEG